MSYMKRFEEDLFELLTEKFGREPTDEEMKRAYEQAMNEAEARAYDMKEAELKGN